MKPTLINAVSFGMIKVSRHTSAREAHRLMEQMNIRHLPVVDEDKGTVVGLLSDRDLLRSPHPDRPVCELMSNPILSFDVNTPLIHVAQAMIDQKVSSFLITTDNEINGIVTTEDLLQVLIELLKEQPSAKWIVSDFLVRVSAQNPVSPV